MKPFDCSKLPLLAECKEGKWIIHLKPDSRNSFGIYAIIFKDGEVYIGQSHHLRKRVCSHCWGIVNKTAKNLPQLIEHYSKCPEFKIFLISDDENGLSENDYIFLYDSPLNRSNPLKYRVESSGKSKKRFSRPRNANSPKSPTKTNIIQSDLRVKELLKEKGITAKEFAPMIGMTETGLCIALGKKGNPSLNKLREMARILNVPLAQLFTDTSKQSETIVHHCSKCGNRITVKLIFESEGETEIENN